MPELSPREAALRGRVGAYVLHSRRDPRETTAPARAAFLARFEREVDPNGTLPPAERHRRALAARKAYFARLALKSARARRAGRLDDGAVDAAPQVPTDRGAPVADGSP